MKPRHSKHSYDKDLLFRWIRAARVVAQEQGKTEVDSQVMKEAAKRLSKAIAHKRERRKLLSRPFVDSPETSGLVLPDSPHARRPHSELAPPSDWLVQAVARHEDWLRAIARRAANAK